MARGCIRPQTKGSWEISYELPRTPDGKRRRETETVRGPKRDAERALAERIRQVETGSYIPKANITVTEFLERFLTELAPLTAPSPSTLKGYRSKLRAHVIPHLGHLKLQQLTTNHVQTLYADLMKGGRGRWGRDLSRQTIHHVHVILRGALSKAVDLEIIPKNPCDGAQPPSVEEQEAASLTPDELLHLLKVTRGTNLEVPVHLAGGAGLRRGELLALKWEDVDLDRAMLRVRHSVYMEKGLKLERPPKSRRGVRTLPLPEILHLVLAEHQQEQAAERQRPGYQDRGLVVADPQGGYIRDDTLSRQFKRLTKQLGLVDISLHSLRHTYASLMADAEGNVKVVQELMGHAHPKVTLRYTHTQKEQHRRAVDAFNKIVSEAEKNIEQ